MTLVKICGLRSPEHALAALDAGADILGFIFAPFRRQILPDAAAAIARQVRGAAEANGRRVALVGVFVNEAPERMLAIAGQCDLDAIQLSGDEPAAVVPVLSSQKMLIKTLRLNDTAAEQSWLELPQSRHVQFHVDAQVAGSYGGAGVVADWERAADLARERPIILAGGLTPENVGAAIRQVRPVGVDVSSGVETDGVKDVAKIRAFVTAARNADKDLAREPSITQ